MQKYIAKFRGVFRLYPTLFQSRQFGVESLVAVLSIHNVPEDKNSLKFIGSADIDALYRIDADAYSEAAEARARAKKKDEAEAKEKEEGYTFVSEDYRSGLLLNIIAPPKPALPASLTLHDDFIGALEKLVLEVNKVKDGHTRLGDYAYWGAALPRDYQMHLCAVAKEILKLAAPKASRVLSLQIQDKILSFGLTKSALCGALKNTKVGWVQRWRIERAMKTFYFCDEVEPQKEPLLPSQGARRQTRFSIPHSLRRHAA